ncbi:MAG: fatty acid desaturase [Acidobacteriota bacterium]
MNRVSSPIAKSEADLSVGDCTAIHSGTKAYLSMPKVAWPTLFLALGCLSLWITSLLLSLKGTIPMTLGLVLAAVCAFISFTPMHDSAHRTLARIRWLNEVMGRVCALVLMFPFPALRYVHLEHHRHTNDAVKDPDLWSGSGSVWLLPLRWFTQDIHYCLFYLKQVRQRPTAEYIEILFTLALLWTSVITLCLTGYTSAVLLLWVLPSRIAVILLAYGFDYLPHKPHQISAAENVYAATMVRPSPLLTPVLLYQNYHLIHHLYPGIPFYRYSRVWRDQREALLGKGVEVRDLFGRKQTNIRERLH